MTNITKLKSPLNVIHCSEKNVYGRILIYATEPKTAKMLAVLTNKSTLDYRDLEALKNLGFDIQLTKLPI